MKRQRPVKCQCLWCHEVFYIRHHRLVDLSSGAHRRGIACSNPCRIKLLRSWLMVGMERDRDYQALLKERAKLRALVQAQL